MAESGEHALPWAAGGSEEEADNSQDVEPLRLCEGDNDDLAPKSLPLDDAGVTIGQDIEVMLVTPNAVGDDVSTEWYSATVHAMDPSLPIQNVESDDSDDDEDDDEEQEEEEAEQEEAGKEEAGDVEGEAKSDANKGIQEPSTEASGEAGSPGERKPASAASGAVQCGKEEQEEAAEPGEDKQSDSSSTPPLEHIFCISIRTGADAEEERCNVVFHSKHRMTDLASSGKVFFRAPGTKWEPIMYMPEYKSAAHKKRVLSNAHKHIADSMARFGPAKQNMAVGVVTDIMRGFGQWLENNMPEDKEITGEHVQQFLRETKRQRTG